jgi:hypothetical protein
MKGEVAYESSALAGTDEIPPTPLVEIAVGVVMQCLALRPVDARSYLLGRARSEARAVDDLGRRHCSASAAISRHEVALLRSWAGHASPQAARF